MLSPTDDGEIVKKINKGASLPGDFPYRGFSHTEVKKKNFEKLSWPRNFAFEIAYDRAAIRVARRRQALPRGMKVPKHCSERRHAGAREISCDSQRIFFF